MPYLSKEIMALPLGLLVCFIIGVECSHSQLDRIAQLPGQPPVGFQQYSGYVTVDDKNQKALFYYFAEAEIDCASKPLVLWLNGGPGCSSLGVGAFSENGPFRPSGEGLVKNQYSWNREANMLYLETPIGVGFSYSTNTSSYEGVDDKITARDNLVFLQKWFVKFQQYRNRSLFITGESYAGGVSMLKTNFFSSQSKQLGNPVLEYSTDFNSRAEFFWSHGLISDTTYKMFTSVCNYSRYVSEYYRGSVSPRCSRVMSQVTRETSRFVDKYDVTLDVCISSVLSQSKVLTPKQVGDNVDVCVEDETVNYLNRPDVQMALHARLVGVRRWAVCSTGDQDSVIPLTGSRKLVHGLSEELGLKTTVPYRVWFEGQQVGGWTQVYDNILSFATIRGASHEAPFSQPERSLVLFKAFLGGQPLPEAF
ncbi:hypothetical protein DKX38_000449 [Salix brachista]|uniref:Carboxypeptidase n=1 Tax=Salix brachista TaxID=2182728 RepID=A0A5N5P0U8_9ROSI|nr:hypothetical protein DKX38_000449 [Salix brachista]